MRVAIVGAGAMGTLLGHGFCRSGHEVSILDLPERIAQIQDSVDLVVIGEGGVESSATPLLTTTDPADAGVNDIVILATKSQDLPSVAQSVSVMTSAESAIVTIQNGIPWWYLQELPGDFRDRRIDCLDPDGLLERFIKPSQIVGCVAYPAAEMQSDGRVRHVEGWRFPVGDIDGVTRDRTHAIAALLEDSGFKSRVIDDIRSEIWLKAWGALSINPISALTRATMEDICTFTDTRDLIAQMMCESKKVAEALGASFRHTIEKRIAGARAVGPHKTSMLQDVERGRPLELDALMLAVLELADLVGEETPAIKTVYACTALLNDNLLSMRGESGAGDR